MHSSDQPETDNSHVWGVPATELLVAAAIDLAGAWQQVGGSLPHSEVDIANEVLRSRLVLYRCLIDLGWTPPMGVQAQMLSDEQLTHEGVGAAYDDPVRLPDAVSG